MVRHRCIFLDVIGKRTVARFDIRDREAFEVIKTNRVTRYSYFIDPPGKIENGTLRERLVSFDRNLPPLRRRN